MELVTEHRQMGDSEKVMVYLSRNPGTNSSCMQWKFDFTDTGLSIDRLNIRFYYVTSEDGHVKAYLKPDFRGEVDPPEDPPERIVLWSIPTMRSIPEAQGWRKFSLIVEMGCKRSPCVFHHTQLFLQQQSGGFFEKEEKKYPFKIEIVFA
ncbi:peptide-N(4)-(N-acetyl-beta-glucosaminyl)asparagine amidase-like [Paramacrobiotus metropolitanus]|uniref:peptide-N(4)-(N-acetyl-beta- glucosaminyl)asparagine amidase-like n=1 Tax=Paramacrobiotus metropolitanus TaxID=2943436 RepID=UPI00244629D7|nr:peptide-N(4)-(N-acetyl-beta-glucosaminyl)asparagine amidase-like [Paramacrobiotus metropolitanus]XP_055327176.1 peptide-N(4)-(N-acetyl-beta-glucosaminyl)asparagine amidase-like [Paramacrobiotus metropolitanus]XP_055327177.1 peptide-N(4)-(N-acetyl-beta-glucosaminyl)asparagine amidase-like [Paramacrobiotus metropolitanus]XP_055327178.1 peptide-N(4)-(N-acetyl-beta-glucosaminyl)asparagine amidase-like [Paramacrobiotus metropolitanus]